MIKKTVSVILPNNLTYSSTSSEVYELNSWTYVLKYSVLTHLHAKDVTISKYGKQKSCEPRVVPIRGRICNSNRPEQFVSSALYVEEFYLYCMLISGVCKLITRCEISSYANQRRMVQGGYLKKYVANFGRKISNIYTFCTHA